MMHYHGTPITPKSALQQLAGRNFCVSFAHPQDVKTVHEIGQSVMLDNGAFSAWRLGIEINWWDYYKWCEEWLCYPTTWAVIPDVIDGTEEDNDKLIKRWPFGRRGAPVWHLNESLDRLRHMICYWQRVCFGSSGDYAKVGSDRWHLRVSEAFDVVAPEGVGRPTVWVHMMRGMALAGSHYPFASVDSTNVAQNHKRDGGPVAIAGYWDAKQCPGRWNPSPKQLNLDARAPDPRRFLRDQEASIRVA